MKKNTLLFLILFNILFTNNVHAQYEKNKTTIALNLNECPSCYNNLRHLKNLKHSDLIYVLPAASQPDSESVIASYGIPPKAKIMWSDDAQKKLLINGIASSVNFIIGLSQKTIQADLKMDMNENIISYVNKLSLPIDTIAFDIPIITSGTTKIVNHGTSIYTQDNISNKLSAYDIIKKRKIFDIIINDSLMKKAFYAKYRDKENNTYLKSMKIINDLGLIKYKRMSTFYVNDTSISIMANYTLFEVIDRPEKNDKDTFELQLMAIHNFNRNGTYISTQSIQAISVDINSRAFLNNPSVYAKEYYNYIDNYLHRVDDKILLNIIRTPDMTNIGNYFAAYFKPDTSGNYVFDKYYSQQLPVEYEKYGYNFYNMESGNDVHAFILPLSSTIYDVKDNYTVKLPVTNEPQFMGLPFSARIFYHYASLNSTGIFLLLEHTEEKKYEYYKFDKKGKQLIDKKPIGNTADKYVRNSIIDYYDSNYIISPINNKTLIRYRIFN